jgi:histidine kinase
MSTAADNCIPEVIAEDGATVTHRVRRGDRTVLVRTPRDAHPSADVLARLRYGAATAQALDVPGVTRVLGVEEASLVGGEPQPAGGLAVVLEDMGGRTLRSVLADGRMEITEAVRIATQVARILGALQARRVVHKRIEPSSILVNVETGQVQVTNFDVASRQDREEPALAGPSPAGGPLAYVAPEQTGRVNRGVDFRADLYALGVTLYEMLTGEVPFPGSATDHAERAALGEHAEGSLGPAPIPPERLRPSIPSALSEVALKLLARDAEDRYQSAEGLVSDLNECLGHLVEGATLADFQIGRNDVTTCFLLPQQLYGRTAQRAMLVAALTRASRGAAELYVVSGPSGVGKTALVNELRATCVRERAYFCSGSGDPVRAAPYGALGQALGELCQEIVASGEDLAGAFRRRLLDAVGPGIALVVAAIPALRHLVGPLPAVPALGPAEARDRFDLAFQQTIGVFACREHPLALFLDDLQWVDAASLRMLEILLRDPGCRHLFVVVAHEALPDVTAESPVDDAIAAVQAGPTLVHQITLEPLGERDGQRFVADALACPSDEPPLALAALVQRTAEGSPLFMHQLLTWLHATGAIALDPGSGRWQYHPEARPHPVVPDDIGALFDARIGALPPASARMLSVAACFGRRFDLATVARAAGHPRHEAATALWAAVEVGLLHPIGGAYRGALGDPPSDVAYAFLHARAHAAALARIAPDERVSLRRKAGRQLLAEAADEDRSTRLFHVADLLLGAAPSAPEERLEMVRRDLAAGTRARQCNAHAAAQRYLAAGLALLHGDADTRTEPAGPGAPGDFGAWQTAYPLAFALHREHAVCACLEGRVVSGEAELDLLRERARSEGDRAAIDRLQVTLANGRSDFPGAIHAAIAALARQGIVLPEREEAARALAGEIEAVNAALVGQRIGSLIDAPVTEDAAERARVELLSLTLRAASQCDLDRFRLLGAIIVGRSLRHGHAPFSSLGYVAYAVVASPGSDQGDELVRLALRLAERLDDPGVRAVVQCFSAVFASPRRRALGESLDALEQAHVGALAAGDLRLAGHAAMLRLHFGLMSGEDLYRLQDRAGKYLALLQRLGRTISAALTASILRTLLLLTRGPSGMTGPPSGHHDGGSTQQPYPASARRGAPSLSDSYSGDDLEPPVQTSGDAGAMASHFVIALERAFLFEDYRRALEHAAHVAVHIGGVRGHPVEAEHRYYHALALAADDPAAAPLSDAERRERRLVIAGHQEKLAVWAEGSPAGFGHRYLLVSAEAARLAGDDRAAMDLYERALESAAKHQHPGGEALSAELGARFHLAAGRRHVARAYLLHAQEAYARWGADAKVADLRRRHGDFLPEAPAPTAPGTAGATLDLVAVIRASQAISGELSTDDLLRTLMTSVLEAAGATRGLLVIRGEGAAVVTARVLPEGGVSVSRGAPSLEAQAEVAHSILRHVERTKTGVVLEDASADGAFRSDPYVVRVRPRSVLCLPLLRQGRLLGALYVENNHEVGAFSPERRAALEMLAAQAAISLENARAHEALARRTRAQDEELARANADLTGALTRVKDAQKRLLVQEKLATLGGLTAGIAHEIKNPLNFINNFAESSVGIADEILEELRQLRARIDPEALANLEELLGELRRNAAKINEHGRRADDIVRSMLEHSRGGSAAARAVDLNALLKEYVNLAYQGFRSQDASFNTTIETSYAAGLAPMSLQPQDMGRVFLNLVNNACYAVHAKKKALGRQFAPVLKVSTRDLGQAVELRVRDNGMGIPAEVRERMFQPFFTTKPTGDGTGLGLSISLDIVTGQGGTLEVATEEGQFTEFIITLPRKTEAI